MLEGQTTSPAVIFVCGLSGVGKSHMLDNYLNNIEEITVVSAGNLIAESRQRLNRDQFATLPLEELKQSQELLLRGLEIKLQSVETPTVVLDGHVLIDNGAPETPYRVPFEVFLRMNLKCIVHLFALPEIIAERRQLDTSRKRPVRSALNLARQQGASRLWAKEICDRLVVPYFECASGDSKAMRRFCSSSEG
jgi:adenylate kinase